MKQNGIDVPSVHRFNTMVAEDLGLPAAILFQDISYWVNRNRRKDINLINGRHWVHDSVRNLCKRHHYLSEYQIQSALKKLEEAKLIETDYLNRTAYDHTRWFTLGTQAPHYLPLAEREAAEKTEQSMGQFLGGRHPSFSGVDTEETSPLSSMIDCSQGNPPQGDFPLGDNYDRLSLENPSEREFSTRDYDRRLWGETSPDGDFSPQKSKTACEESALWEGDSQRQSKTASEASALGWGDAQSRNDSTSAPSRSRRGSRRSRRKEPEQVFPYTTPGGTVVLARTSPEYEEVFLLIEGDGDELEWKRESEVK